MAAHSQSVIKMDTTMMNDCTCITQYGLFFSLPLRVKVGFRDFLAEMGER